MTQTTDSTNQTQAQAEDQQDELQDEFQKQSDQRAEGNCPKCEENLALAQRARADYENLKRETERWRENFAQFANQHLIMEILPVIDNFFSAMEHIPEDQKTADWVVGVMYIKKQLLDVLEKEGVLLYGEVGDAFNPHMHEAVEEVKGKEEESGKVITVVRHGCKIGERVIRPAQVVVGK